MGMVMPGWRGATGCSRFVCALSLSSPSHCRPGGTGKGGDTKLSFSHRCSAVMMCQDHLVFIESQKFSKLVFVVSTWMAVSWLLPISRRSNTGI